VNFDLFTWHELNIITGLFSIEIIVCAHASYWWCCCLIPHYSTESPL